VWHTEIIGAARALAEERAPGRDERSGSL
jgi:hypothetical protein